MITKVLYDTELDDYVLDLGDVCEELGWDIGDTLEWIDNGDGSWTIRKVADKDETI